MSDHDDSSPTAARSLFADYLGRLERGEPADFEALCREHAVEAAELRRLKVAYDALYEKLREARPRAEEVPRGSLLERLQQEFGSDTDSGISIHDGSREDSTLTREVVAGLALRSGAFSRYRFDRKIAEGGMGVVLRVWDEDLRRWLAMKLIRARRAGEPAQAGTVDSRTLGRFLDEAQVTGQLDHPGIVPIHELGLDAEGRVYFTMKLVEGQTLQAVFDELARGEGGWTQTRVLGLLLKVCEAMSYAHAKRVIHRDLKPSNVMVGRYGEVYVMDWGLARVLGQPDHKDIRIRPADGSGPTRSGSTDHAGTAAESPPMTMDGDVLGTPAYMPPEQARGEVDRLDERADVYALGAMLYQLLAGRSPHVRAGERPSWHALLSRVLDGPPEALQSVGPRVPLELAAICEKAMAREPGGRYANTSALADDLAAFLEDRVVRAYEAGPWAETRKWVQRNRPLAVALAATVLLLVAGLISSLLLKAQSDANAERADAKADEAQKNLALAQRKEAEAQARADDVLRLSALQHLEDLLLQADSLWPPYPQYIDDLRAWAGAAESLVSELPSYLAKRAGLRALASPRNDEERRRDQESHPDYPRLAAVRRELIAKQRALLQRREGISAELPDVDGNEYPDDPRALLSIAAPLVDPKGGESGQEALALALALRALELAGDDQALRSDIYTTIAKGNFALGRDDDALNAAYDALDSAPARDKMQIGTALAKLEEAVAAAASEEGLVSSEREVEALQEEREALEARVDERRDWQFPEELAEARWWNNQLTKLIEGLEEMQTGLLAPDAITDDHGWSIPKRLAAAQELEVRFAQGGDSFRAWSDALPAIRETYPGLDLKPQMGLLPIGADPESGLWQFAHVLTGKPPERGAEGKLVLTDETGVVLVLLRGGTSWLGAQSMDPDLPNFDPHAGPSDQPVRKVTLAAFFISKFEMTQSQWQRLTGSNPSMNQRNSLSPSLVHPVEQVSWNDCVTALSRVGLLLPSEAQWEYAARGGTDTPWWTGATRETLREQRAANLADQAAARANADWPEIQEWPELDDGFAAHAPIGVFAANPFGLHEITANVWEWCIESSTGGVHEVSAWKTSSSHLGIANQVFRGGGFSSHAKAARSTSRVLAAPSLAASRLGVRPARLVVH